MPAHAHPAPPADPHPLAPARRVGGARPVGRVLLGAVLAVLALVLAACSSSSTSGSGGTAGSAAPGRPRVVVTTAILGDIARSVVGDVADVEVLVPNGSDPHEFEPSAAEAAGLRDADLIVTNGLGLEAGLQGAIDSARDAGVPVLELGPQLNPVPFSSREGNGGAGSASGGDEADALDPHVWMDPDRMTRAASLLAAEVAKLGVDRATLDRRATEYAATLARADEQIQAALAPLPDDRRILVTNHEAMGYFADRYGFRVLGVIVPGGSTLAEPSAADLADLADAIRAADVPVIFAETTAPTKLADALATETGRDVRVVELYTEALGEPGSGADTYPGMLVTNARRIAEGFGVAGAAGTTTTNGG